MTVTSAIALVAFVRSKTVGDVLALTVRHAGAERPVTVTLSGKA